jgi:serine/threonine-protein phosphatase 2A regulatory subunit A
MQLLVKVSGDEWVISQLLPQHERIFNQNTSSYLVRMTIIQSHVEAAVFSKSGAMWNDVVSQILRGLNDKVANVRMVAATGLARVVMEGDSAMVTAQIRPALEKRMQEDGDYDCRQACEQALAHIK